MTRARKELVAVEDTPFYHCISRCVRRAYLCGEDYQTGKNFDHRKGWLVDRTKFLASVFTIDICAYAVMSNHYHLVLFINQDVNKSLTQEEVVERWGMLFPGSTKRIKDLLAISDDKAVRKMYEDKVELWRAQLGDISWFMRCLNEFVARMANKEDNCKGRFWEGRFKSQALLDENALLSCMAYVDLNPVRAKMASTPEASDFTSIQERIVQHAKHCSKRSREQKKLIKHYNKTYHTKAAGKGATEEAQAKLKPLNGSCHAPLSEGIPFTRQDYFELVDWTGRIVREGKRGAIEESLPPILKRLGIEAERWVDSVSHFQRYFFDVAGTTASLEQYQQRRNAMRKVQVAPIEWVKGKGASKRLFG